LIADEVMCTIKVGKNFGQAFLKACAVKGAEPLSRSAEREILLSAFLFWKLFSLRLWCQREKWLRLFCWSGKESYYRFNIFSLFSRFFF